MASLPPPPPEKKPVAIPGKARVPLWAWVLLGMFALGVVASAISSGGKSLVPADPCPIVQWWADTSGSVPQPGDAPESLAEAQAIADSLPGDEGAAFMQLYDDLDSNLSDAAYGNEAERFEASYC